VARVQLPAAKTGFETDGDRATAPSHGIAVAPDGKSLWVTSIPNNAVYVYSLADWAYRRSRPPVPIDCDQCGAGADGAVGWWW
jgi:DNA-binding beta-propeller fold protein YncE